RQIGRRQGGDGEGGGRRPGQGAAAGGERVARPGPVERQVGEGGHAVGRRHGRGAVQRGAARVAAERQRDGGGAVRGDVAERVEQLDSDRRREGLAGDGVGRLLDELQGGGGPGPDVERRRRHPGERAAAGGEG